MENLINFVNGRLSSIKMLESVEDRKILYNQVFGACEFFASFGGVQAAEAKKIWEDFSWKFFEIIYDI